MARPTQTSATINDPSEDTKTNEEETETVQKGKPKNKKTLPLELVQRRMGFRNTNNLLLGSLHDVWDDTAVHPATRTDDWPVKVSISHKHNRSKTPMQQGVKPFYMLHMDLD